MLFTLKDAHVFLHLTPPTRLTICSWNFVHYFCNISTAALLCHFDEFGPDSKSLPMRGLLHSKGSRRYEFDMLMGANASKRILVIRRGGRHGLAHRKYTSDLVQQNPVNFISLDAQVTHRNRWTGMIESLREDLKADSEPFPLHVPEGFPQRVGAIIAF